MKNLKTETPKKIASKAKNAQAKSTHETKKLLVEASTWGIEIASCVITGAFIGIWLDKRFATGPIFLIIFFIFGVTAAFLNIYRRRQSSDQE